MLNLTYINPTCHDVLFFLYVIKFGLLIVCKWFYNYVLWRTLDSNFLFCFLFLFSIFWCQVCSDHIKPVGKWFLLPYFLKDIGIGIIYLFCSWENSPMNPSRFDVFLTGRCVIANSISLVYTEPFFFYSLTCNHFLIIHCVNFDILHFFKEFVNFIYAVKFPGITLFVVFSFHLFKAYRVCRDILSLILGIFHFG